MDRQEAKRILALYRSGDPAAADPAMAEALKFAKHDPELSLWFERHRAFQERVQSEMRTLPIPDNLKTWILHNKASFTTNIWWRRPAFLAAAAAIVVMLGLGVYWWQPNEEATFSSFRQRMVRAALREYQMQLVTNDLSVIRTFLSSNRGPSDYALTEKLQKLPGSGCGVLKWRGQSVSMICFDLGAAVPQKNRTLWLFIIDKAAIPDSPRGEKPRFLQVTKLMTASWTQGNRTYLIAGWGDQDALQRYF